MGRAKFSVCPCLFCLFLLQVDRAYKLINNLYCPCTFIPPIPFSGRRYSFYLFSDIYFSRLSVISSISPFPNIYEQIRLIILPASSSFISSMIVA